MKKMKFFFTALAALFISVAASAADIVVTGKVVDANTREGIPGAAVQLKGSVTVYALTDIDGSYAIEVPSDAVLVVSCLGYLGWEQHVNGQKVVNIVLSPDSEMLEQAVAVGYGSSKKVGNIVGNVTTIKADVVKNSTAASALDLLQGQVAGMQVLSTGGVAGDNNISMKIHGSGSLTTSAEPLFIVDGIQSSSSAVMAMNPNDILNVTVLKDASSTSIYGAQGANGVVFVTTKAGKFDSDATVTVTSQYGISTLANKQFYDNMMSASELKNFWIRSGLMTAEQIKTTYTSKGYDANTVWYQYFQRLNNPQYQNDVTIEGGSSKTAYMVGASQFHQDGNTIGNYYDRYTVRTNVQARPKDWLKMGVNANLSLTSTQQNDNWGDSTGQDSNYLSGGLSYLLNPLHPAVDENGDVYPVKFPNGLTNPYYYYSVYQSKYDTYRLQGSAYMEIEPLKNLIFTSRVGTDASVQTADRFGLPSGEMFEGSGMVQKSSYFAAKTTVTNTLEYSFSLGQDHSVSVLGGQEYVDYNYFSHTAYGRGMTDDRYLSLDYATQATKQVAQNRSQYRFLSFFGHADYSFQDKYLLDFTVRNDASSRFGGNNRNGIFWATGFMWKAKKEDFLKNADAINSLNFKASYGSQGNAGIGNYRYLGIVSALSTPYNAGTGIILEQPSNNDLKWETQKLFTVSAEAKVFDKYTVELSYYDRRTEDMLMNVPQPYTSGFTSVFANVGSLRNNGIDITFEAELYKTREAYVNTHFTFGYNKETITELFNGLDRWEIAGTGVAYVVGMPVMYYAPIYAGVDPADGAPMWYLPAEDEEGNVLKDVCTMDPERTTKVYDAASLTQNTGLKRNEPINGGFGLSAGYKGLFCRADFAFILGKKLINNDAYFYANPNVFAGQNQSKEVSDFWTPYNTDAKYPDWKAGYEMQIEDSHLIEDASFLRLKTLVLGYTLPKQVVDKTVFKGISLTLTGRNLLTFTNFGGMDPEVDSNLTLGIPGNTLQVLGGLELKF